MIQKLQNRLSIPRLAIEIKTSEARTGFEAQTCQIRTMLKGIQGIKGRGKFPAAQSIMLDVGTRFSGASWLCSSINFTLEQQKKQPSLFGMLFCFGGHGRWCFHTTIPKTLGPQKMAAAVSWRFEWKPLPMSDQWATLEQPNYYYVALESRQRALPYFWCFMRLCGILPNQQWDGALLSYATCSDSNTITYWCTPKCSLIVVGRVRDPFFLQIQDS